jgi:hypothetical protein
VSFEAAVSMEIMRRYQRKDSFGMYVILITGVILTLRSAICTTYGSAPTCLVIHPMRTARDIDARLGLTVT